MKKLEGFEQIGFTVDNAHNVAFGMIGGYKFIVNFLSQQRQYSIITTVKSDNEMGVLAQGLEMMDKGNFINWTHYNDNVAIVNVKNDSKLTVWELEGIMKNVASLATQNNYVQCCRHCHETVPVNVCHINGENDLVCSTCLGTIAASQPPLKEVNFPLGIVGALLGSLIGVIAWVIIYQLGIIAGLVGFVMAVCCFKGYEMLGGRIDKKGIWVALVIAIIMLAVAEYVCLGLEIQSAVSEFYGEIGFMESLRSVPFFLEDSEIMGAVVKDMLFGYGFMAVASYSYIKNIHKQVSSAGIVEKID